MATIKVNLEGRGTVALTDKDYVAQGGQGTVYRKGDTVVKIYLDAKTVDRDKVIGLAKLKHPYIASPGGFALDSKGTAVGFFMPWVDGSALSLFFTNDFRQKENITDSDSSTLAEKMRATMEYAHANNAIMVDPNELNWLAILKGKDGLEPRIIDTDGWVLNGKIPPTVAKMPSIRDWHGKSVSEASDWFAWSIVTFLLYTGIHPFKGRLAGYKPSEMERRMKDNASVFTPGVTLNSNVREFKVIPPKLLDWYRKTFSTTERTIPPSPFDLTKAPPAALVARTVVSGTSKLKHEKVFERLTDHVIRIFPCGVALTKSKKLYDMATGDLIYKKADSPDCQLIRVEDGWLLGDSGKFSFLKVGEEPDPVMLYASGTAVAADSRMFLANEAGLNEMTLRQMGRNILSAGTQPWGCLYNSTTWFDGLGVMDAMGATFLIIPFGGNAVAQMRVRELDGLKPLTAKSCGRFTSVIGLDDSGVYQKKEFYFNAQMTEYKEWKGVAESPELNMTILPKGVAATIIEDGQLVIFVPSTGLVNKLVDKDVSTSMLLARSADTVLYINNGQVWSVKS